MRLTKWMEVLTLSTNLYLLSRDKEFMERLSKISRQAGESLFKFMSEDESRIDFKTLREKIFSKLDLLTTVDANRIEKTIAELRKEIALAEARIVAIENHRKHHV